jgi:hypothetical protein
MFGDLRLDVYSLVTTPKMLQGEGPVPLHPGCTTSENVVDWKVM